MPGIRPMAIAATPATTSGVENCESWREVEVPRSSSAVDRVTIMPVAVAISSAGIWVTRPSPMDSRA